MVVTGQTVVKTVVVPLMTMVTVVVVVDGGANVVLLFVGCEVCVVVWDGAEPVLLWVGRVLLWDSVDGGGSGSVLLWVGAVPWDVVVLDVTGMVVLLLVDNGTVLFWKGGGEIVGSDEAVKVGVQSSAGRVKMPPPPWSNLGP